MAPDRQDRMLRMTAGFYKAEAEIKVEIAGVC